MDLVLGSRVKCGRDPGVILRLHSALGGVDVGVILGVIGGTMNRALPSFTWLNLVMPGVMGGGLPGLAFRSEVAEHLALLGVIEA